MQKTVVTEKQNGENVLVYVRLPHGEIHYGRSQKDYAEHADFFCKMMDTVAQHLDHVNFNIIVNGDDAVLTLPIFKGDDQKVNDIKEALLERFPDKLGNEDFEVQVEDKQAGVWITLLKIFKIL